MHILYSSQLLRYLSSLSVYNYTNVVVLFIVFALLCAIQQVGINKRVNNIILFD